MPRPLCGVDFSLLRSLFLSFHPIYPDIEKNDFKDKSLYQLLRSNYGLEIDKVKRGIEAVAAAENEARLLQVELGAHLLQIESTSYTPDGKPVEYFIAKRRGDRPRFKFELSKPPKFNVS